MDPDQNSSTTSFRELRRRVGTQSQVATAVGVHRKTIYNLEHGRSRPLTADLACRIGDVVGLTSAQALKLLRKQTVGDPCPCGCGGKRALRDGVLGYEVPCNGCGTVRFYRYCMNHRRLGTCCSQNKSERSLILPELTHAEIGKYLGCRGGIVARWENRRYLPKWRWLRVINECLPAYAEGLIKRSSHSSKMTLGILQTLSDTNKNVTVGPCVGLDDHNAKNQHHPGCDGLLTLTRKKLYDRRHATGFRTEEEANNLLWQHAFISDDLKRFRCGHCAGKSYGLWVLEQKLKGITDERINSAVKRDEILNDSGYIFDGLWGGLIPAQRRLIKWFVIAALVYRTNFSWQVVCSPQPWKYKQKKNPDRIRRSVITRIVANWSNLTKLPHYNFSLCRGCGYIIATETKGHSPQFCFKCYPQRARILKTKSGRKITDRKLRVYIQWTILHCLGRESYRDIAKNRTKKKTGRHFTTVEEKVIFVLKHLDPLKVPHFFRNTANSLLNSKA